MVRLLLSDEVYPVNIGNPNETTILTFAETINRLTGNAAGIEYRQLPEDDPKQRRPIIARARQILDWSPQVDLEQGLSRTIYDFEERLAR